MAPAAFPTCPDKSRGPRQASHERTNNETMGEIKHGDITLFIPYNCWRACPARRLMEGGSDADRVLFHGPDAAGETPTKIKIRPGEVSHPVCL